MKMTRLRRRVLVSSLVLLVVALGQLVEVSSVDLLSGKFRIFDLTTSDDESHHGSSDSEFSSLDLDPLTGKYMTTKSMIDYAKLFSIGCPKKGGIRSEIGKTRFVFVSPTTFKDVIVDLQKDNPEQSARNLINEGFNLTQPSLLYLPGWKETSSASWLRRIRRRYKNIFKAGKRKSTFNLLIYEYPEDCDDAYRKVVKKVPALGKTLAEFLNTLTERFDYKMDHLHMIGFSLSTHIVGVAGRHLGKMNNPLRQVTVLDPAGPCFFGSSDFAKENTVSSDSAKLVVARHYGFGILGAQRSVGGVDIFVNGGKEQPLQIRRPHKYLVMWNSQGNHRASAFHEALSVFNGSCYDVAYKCESYEKFLAGACADCEDPSNCFHIGSLIKGGNRSPQVNYQPNTRMYINAGGSRFCLHHYQLVVQLRANASAETVAGFEAGKIRVDLGDDLPQAKPKRMTTCSGERAYTTLVTSEKPLAVRDVTLFNKKTSKFINPAQIRMVRLNYMSHPFKADREARSVTLCQSGPELLSTGTCKSDDRANKCF